MLSFVCSLGDRKQTEAELATCPKRVAISFSRGKYALSCASPLSKGASPAAMELSFGCLCAFVSHGVIDGAAESLSAEELHSRKCRSAAVQVDGSLEKYINVAKWE